jgi:tRNA(Leu) C34 or U34 (ribose-2'-O)-methylase TrmL
MFPVGVLCAGTAGTVFTFCLDNRNSLSRTLFLEPREQRSHEPVDRISLLGARRKAFELRKAGCSQVLMDAATWRVEIPTNPAVESLNVAAAAAIALYCRYHFNRSRDAC